MRLFMAMVIVTTGLLMPCAASNSDYKEGSMFEMQKIEAVVTAYYTPEEDQETFATGSYKGDLALNGSGTTFCGEEAVIGVVAADLKVFPLGTHIFIPGYGTAVVGDIGAKIKNNRIDVYMGKGEEALEKAMAWGERVLPISIFSARRRGA